MHACLLVRDLPLYRRHAFEGGLRAIGYTVDQQINAAPDNLLVIWNRYSMFDEVAREYERRGGRVLVAENGYLGRDWQEKHWYAIGRSQHNTLSDYQLGDPARVGEVGIVCEDWRTDGHEIVILETRSIGPNTVREPSGWSKQMLLKLKGVSKYPVRLRKHPGETKCVPLDHDLKDAKAVVTWGSGGALKALTWGIPVFHGYAKWIGSEAGQFIDLNAAHAINHPYCGDRAKTMRRIAWAMWNTDEIERGAGFTWLLR